MKNITKSVLAGILIAIGGSVFLASDNKYIGATLFSVALLCICYLEFNLFTGKIGYVVEDHSLKNVGTLLVCLLVNLVVTFLLGMLISWLMPSLGEKAALLCGGNSATLDAAASGAAAASSAGTAAASGAAAVAGKLDQTFLATFVRAIFCGILMYLAVAIYKEKKTVVGILFCIPVFILSGFEHSIADAFYFGASGLAFSSGTLATASAASGTLATASAASGTLATAASSTLATASAASGFGAILLFELAAVLGNALGSILIALLRKIN